MQDLTFSTQADVDSFEIKYPNCSVVDVNLWVTGDSIGDLSPFSKLKKANGLFHIDGCQKLTSLTGLDSLQEVGKNFTVSSCQKLNSVSALKSLKKCGKGLLFQDNNLLADLSGLENLEQIVGPLTIWGNDQLASVAALGKIQLTSGIDIRNNAMLASLDGLQNVASVSGDLTVEGHPKLVDLAGLSSLAQVSGSFSISNNEGLESLGGLEKLTAVGYNFKVSQNKRLKNVAGLSSLGSIGASAHIFSNDSLQTLSGFGQVLSPISGLYVENNLSLTDFGGGFRFLPNIEHDFWIVNNPKLVSVEGFEYLKNVPNWFKIASNGGLKKISGFSMLGSVGEFLIESDAALEEISGFGNLKSTGASFQIKQCAALSKILGFDDLEIVNLSFDLSDLASLDSVSALSALLTIKQSIIINGTNLKSLDFLSSLVWNDGHVLWVTNNAQLSDCDAHFICNKLLSLPSAVTISGNAAGCGYNDVLEGCQKLLPWARGRILTDFDCNGQANGTDGPVKNFILRDDQTAAPFAATDSSGQFFRFLKVGMGQGYAPTVLPSYQSQPAFQFHFPNSIADTFPNADFRLCPVGQAVDLRISVACDRLPRPGFSSVYSICVENVGSSASGATVIFDLSKAVDSTSNLVASVASSPQAVQSGAVLTWQIPPIEPLAGPICVELAVEWKTTAPLGGQVFTSAMATPDAPDANFSDNAAQLDQPIVGAFDPNDKTPNRSEIDVSPDPGAAAIDYQIRFQNTGNFPADFVQILDTLPAILDPRTLEMLQASHPYILEFPAQNVLKWRFENINLADSASNEAASHGFILFRIKTKTGLAVGEEARNRCGIYFDFNAPVVTNWAVTRFVDALKTKDEKPFFLNFKISPNPTDGLFRARFFVEKGMIATVRLVDEKGATARYFGQKRLDAGENALEFDGSGLAAGAYFLEFENEKGEQRTVRVIKK